MRSREKKGRLSRKGASADHVWNVAAPW
jgi:hypothetical protein